MKRWLERLSQHRSTPVGTISPYTPGRVKDLLSPPRVCTGSPGERLVELGIQFAPKEVELRDGKLFRLDSNATLCINDQALEWSEKWFKREMHRLTKTEVNSGCDEAIIPVQPDAEIPKQGFRIGQP